MRSIYDIEKDWEQNIAHGPITPDLPPVEFPPKSEWKSFLGHDVASTLGVPAGPLLDSNWTELAGKLRWDIVTYKTIRSRQFPSHPLPNVVFIDSNLSHEAQTIETPQGLETLSITNSFGMPSKDPDFLRKDIQRAANTLSNGQLLIASVVGTPDQETSLEADFIEAAMIAIEGGAKVIEANFSCPNVATGEGVLYRDPSLVTHITQALAKAIAPLPLIVKIGAFPEERRQREVFIAAAKGGAAAIAGLNTISRKVSPPLDKSRSTAGICGAAIREKAHEFTRWGRRIIDEEKLSLSLIAMGGVTLPTHIDPFYQLGADAVFSATGMMWNPHIALNYHKEHAHVQTLAH